MPTHIHKKKNQNPRKLVKPESTNLKIYLEKKKRKKRRKRKRRRRRRRVVKGSVLLGQLPQQ